MKGGLIRERRGLEEKQGRKFKVPSMSSLNINTPPFPLLALIAIVLFYLYLSTYFNYKEDLNRTLFKLKLFLLLLPALLLFLIRSSYHHSDGGRRWNLLRIPRPEPDSIHRAGGSPWGVAVVVVLLLFMVSYHSSLGSYWFRPLWYSHYY